MPRRDRHRHRAPASPEQSALHRGRADEQCARDRKCHNPPDGIADFRAGVRKQPCAGGAEQQHQDDVLRDQPDRDAHQDRKPAHEDSGLRLAPDKFSDRLSAAAASAGVIIDRPDSRAQTPSKHQGRTAGLSSSSRARIP